MKEFIRIMKALSDPNRVRVLKLLQEGELCVCEIQQVLGLAQSTVSKHMKILEESDLVHRRRRGSWILYSLAVKGDNPYAATMLAHIRRWLEDDNELARMRDNLARTARGHDCDDLHKEDNG